MRRIFRVSPSREAAHAQAAHAQTSALLWAPDAIRLPSSSTKSYEQSHRYSWASASQRSSTIIREELEVAVVLGDCVRNPVLYHRVSPCFWSFFAVNICTSNLSRYYLLLCLYHFRSRSTNPMSSNLMSSCTESEQEFVTAEPWTKQALQDPLADPRPCC
jgi:hypothetical protein